MLNGLERQNNHSLKMGSVPNIESEATMNQRGNGERIRGVVRGNDNCRLFSGSKDRRLQDLF